MPLANTHVVAAGFEAHHAAVAEQAMTATCETKRLSSTPGQPTFDEATGRSVYPTAATIYSGPCRVQRAVRQGAVAVVAGSPTPEQPYVVSMPLAAPLHHVGDVIRILTAVDDELEGALMRVTDVRQGSIVWQRDYSCDDQAPVTR